VSQHSPPPAATTLFRVQRERERVTAIGVDPRALAYTRGREGERGRERETERDREGERER